jgi:hypothetical protein
MHRTRRLQWLAAAALAVCILACAAPTPKPDLLAPTEEQMKLRSLQTRAFDVADRNQAIRGVLSALQDLGFVIERANEPLGVITAARFAEPDFENILEITVTVRAEEAGKMSIRANAIYANEPIIDPTVYQNFFATLERSFFIERN